MRLDQVADMCRLAFTSYLTPALVGTSGVGKTSIFKAVAKDLGFKNVIVLRPSLIADVGDLVGLPDFTDVYTEDGGKYRRTTFNAPDWLPASGDETLVVIDEINRSQKDILQALFDLIEAEHPKIGKYELPKGCKVVATLNPPTSNYSGVIDFNDTAFISRLMFLKITPSLEVFSKWGRDSGEVCEEMLAFLAKNDKFYGLGEDFDVELFFGGDDKAKADHFKNNDRTKRNCSRLYVNAKKLGIGDGILFECMQGIAGKDASTAFLDFAKNYKNEISIDDLLNDPKAHERFDYNAVAMISKVLDDLLGLLDKKKVKEKHYANIFPFLNKIPLDTFSGFFHRIGNLDTKQKEHIKFADALGSDETLLEKIRYALKVKSEKDEKDTAKKAEKTK